MHKVLGCNVLLQQTGQCWQYRVFDHNMNLIVNGTADSRDLALLLAQQKLEQQIMQNYHDGLVRKSWSQPEFASGLQLQKVKQPHETIVRVVLDWTLLYKRLTKQTIHKTVTLPLNVFEQAQRCGGTFSSIVLRALEQYLSNKNKEG